jgi:calcineurin-like phosphoesterase family protein
MSVYFWADTHFNHAYMLGVYPWRGATIREMNANLVALWNGQVTRESDDVWLLGDFGFHAPTKEGTEDLGELFWRLRGRKHLVVGNHDAKNPQVLRLPWESVDYLTEFKLGGQRATLCHYPLETWPASWRGSLMLHGHCHGSLRRKVPKRFDVGVDAEIGRSGPVSWERLVETASKEQFVAQDGHGREREE